MLDLSVIGNKLDKKQIDMHEATILRDYNWLKFRKIINDKEDMDNEQRAADSAQLFQGIGQGMTNYSNQLQQQSLANQSKQTTTNCTTQYGGIHCNSY